LWNSGGSSGLELAVWSAKTGEADWLKERLAGDDYEGLLSAWLMSTSHLAAGSLSSRTSTFPALRRMTSWNLHHHYSILSFI
jgi:hypothetical protein